MNPAKIACTRVKSGLWHLYLEIPIISQDMPETKDVMFTDGTLRFQKINTDETFKPRNAEWDRDATNQRMLSAVDLSNYLPRYCDSSGDEMRGPGSELE